MKYICENCNKIFDVELFCVEHCKICNDKNKFIIKEILFNGNIFNIENILAIKQKCLIKLDKYIDISNSTICNDDIVNEYIEAKSIEKILIKNENQYIIYTTNLSKEHEIECCKKIINDINTTARFKIKNLEDTINKNNEILERLKI